MTDYRVFSGSEQRELAQQIAADLNGGRTLERHAEIAATVLTSDWLAAHDEKVRAEQRELLDKAITLAQEANDDCRKWATKLFDARAEQREQDARIALAEGLADVVSWHPGRDPLASQIAAAIRAVPANTNTEEDH